MFYYIIYYLSLLFFCTTVLRVHPAVTRLTVYRRLYVKLSLVKISPLEVHHGLRTALLNMTRRAVVSRVIRLQRGWTVQLGPVLPIVLVHFRWIFDKSTLAYRNCTHQPDIVCTSSFHLVKISPLEVHHGLRTVHLKIFGHDKNL